MKNELYSNLIKGVLKQYSNSLYKGAFIWFKLDKNSLDNKLLTALINDGQGKFYTRNIKLPHETLVYLSRNPIKTNVSNVQIFFGFTRQFEKEIAILTKVAKDNSPSSPTQIRKKSLLTFEENSLLDKRMKKLYKYLKEHPETFKNISHNKVDVSFRVGIHKFIMSREYLFVQDLKKDIGYSRVQSFNSSVSLQDLQAKFKHSKYPFISELIGELNLRT